MDLKGGVDNDCGELVVVGEMGSKFISSCGLDGRKLNTKITKGTKEGS
jgi:hypothetical protein